MTRVYPKGSATATATATATAVSLSHLKSSADQGDAAIVLTVWKKSMLLNCNGFTVFDAKGNLVFRVDNYIAGNKAQILLMDAAGKPLLTVRRKRLSFGDNWLVYEGETTVNPRFCVRKHVNILNSKCLAHVSSGGGGGGGTSSSSSKNNNGMVYEIEGSYSQRCCAVYDMRNNSKRKVAEIKRKEAVGGVSFGVDVFRLVVQPDQIETAVAMAFVILLDQMFPSSSSFSYNTRFSTTS